MRLKTMRGYDFYEVSSTMQKAIRRADARTAGYFAHEMYASGYWKYVWKRLLTISAEDCHGILTKEIMALRDAFMLINDGRRGMDKGRIFISKAIVLLCTAGKSRDADHLQCYVYDKGMIDQKSKEQLLEEARADDAAIQALLQDDELEIPEYAFDCHTREGKRRGMTKDQFFKDEQAALTPRIPGLFDDVIG